MHAGFALPHLLQHMHISSTSTPSFQTPRYNYFNLKTHPNFYIDATACLPLNCILVSAGRSSYNAGQLIRWAAAWVSAMPGASEPMLAMW